jgi:hypothetical protein
MRWIRTVADAMRRRREAHERELGRLRRMYWESERLRAELSHLEHEIYGIRESRLPRPQKALLESAIRVRCRRVETEMLHRQTEIAASGHLLAHW